MIRPVLNLCFKDRGSFFAIFEPPELSGPQRLLSGGSCIKLGSETKTDWKQEVRHGEV